MMYLFNFILSFVDRHTLGALFFELMVSTIAARLLKRERVSAKVWHARLGHPSPSTTRQIINSHKLPTILIKAVAQFPTALLRKEEGLLASVTSACSIAASVRCLAGGYYRVLEKQYHSFMS